MSVVEFKAKPRDDEYIMVCNCGCASFELRGDGEAVCRACRSIVDEGPVWKHKGPDDPEYDGLVKYSDGGNGDDFSERKAKRGAQDADWIIHGNVAGVVTSWCRETIDSPDREAWLRDGVLAGLDAILEDTGD